MMKRVRPFRRVIRTSPGHEPDRRGEVPVHLQEVLVTITFFEKRLQILKGR